MSWSESVTTRSAEARLAPDRRRPHRRSVGVAVSAGLLCLLLASSAVAAATSPMGWHRLNVHTDPPEHERFGCLANDVWRCRYDKLPGPNQDLRWDQTRGTFEGTDTTSDWACPGWFPQAACDAADTVVSGVGTFVPPDPDDAFSVEQQLLVSDDGILWVYWTDQFVCPWYETFAEASMSESSCTFAP